jgi:hypothetical protein
MMNHMKANSPTDTLRHAFSVSFRGRSGRIITLFVLIFTTASCGSLANARYEPSRWNRATNSQVREDTANLKAGRPLRHFSSEKRLKAERQDQFIDRIMYD